MPELGPDTLKQLASQTGFPRVTIHTPMVRAGAEVRQNRIRLGNAASEAIAQLVKLGVQEREATGLLQPVVDLAEDEARMEHQNSGLSLFVDDAGYESIGVPLELSTRIEVGNRYSIAPLTEPAVNNAEYALLTLSLGGAGLYRCTRFTAEYVELDLPEDLCYVLRYDVYEKSGHVHTASARGDSMHHGHGLGKDEHDAFVKRFVDAVRSKVTAWLERNPVPLVLIGSEDVLGLYRKENTYAETVEQHRTVDPHSLDLDGLIDLGWECMRPSFQQRTADALNRFHAADHTAVDVYSVLPAVTEGRAATVFVDPNQEVRGSFDAPNGAVHVDPEGGQVTENLVDTVIAHALAMGVEIVPVSGEIRTPAAILH